MGDAKMVRADEDGIRHWKITCDCGWHDGIAQALGEPEAAVHARLEGRNWSHGEGGWLWLCPACSQVPDGKRPPAAATWLAEIAAGGHYSEARAVFERGGFRPVWYNEQDGAVEALESIPRVAREVLVRGPHVPALLEHEGGGAWYHYCEPEPAGESLVYWGKFMREVLFRPSA